MRQVQVQILVLEPEPELAALMCLSRCLEQRRPDDARLMVDVVVYLVLSGSSVQT